MYFLSCQSWLQCNFAHAKTAGLSWHVQNYIAITQVFFNLYQWQILYNLEYKHFCLQRMCMRAHFTDSYSTQKQILSKLCFKNKPILCLIDHYNASSMILYLDCHDMWKFVIIWQKWKCRKMNFSWNFNCQVKHVSEMGLSILIWNSNVISGIKLAGLTILAWLQYLSYWENFHRTYRWFIARLQYLQCISNGVTAVSNILNCVKMVC